MVSQQKLMFIKISRVELKDMHIERNFRVNSVVRDRSAITTNISMYRTYDARSCVLAASHAPTALYQETRIDL